MQLIFNRIIMHKLITPIIVVAFLALTIGACKKDEQRSLSNSPSAIEANSKNLVFDETYHVASNGKMLIFRTVEDYENVVNDPTVDQMAQFIEVVQQLPHTTYTEKLAALPEETRVDLIGNAYFSEIINEDFVVQIGSSIYKLNKTTGKVFVLPAERVAEYKDLVEENKANQYIRQFSMEEDVIYLAESGDAGEKLLCGESNAQNPNWSDVQWSGWEPYTGTVNTSDHQFRRHYKSEIKMNYLNLGIFKNLQAKLEVRGYVEVSPTSTGTYGATSFQTLNCIAHIRSNRIYKIRCQSETGWNAVVSALTNPYNFFRCEYNSYQGSKGLRKFWLKGGFYYKTSGNGPEISVYSDGYLPGETLYHREIKSGY